MASEFASDARLRELTTDGLQSLIFTIRDAQRDGDITETEGNREVARVKAEEDHRAEQGRMLRNGEKLAATTPRDSAKRQGVSTSWFGK